MRPAFLVRDPCLGELPDSFGVYKPGACFTGGGSSGGGGDVPANTTSQNTTTYIQDVPQWEQQYLSNLLGQAQTVAGQPYQQFPGVQNAEFTPDQLAAFGNVENLTNPSSPWAANQNQASTAAQAGAQTASGIQGAGSPLIQASTAYNPLAAASPFMGAAANANTPGGISSFMSPYTQDVVGGLVNTANQNWNNNIMPGVNDAFVGSGQFASGRNAKVLGDAANTFQTNLNSQVANTLESGYGQASTNAANQANTLGNLANTAASATGAQAQNLQSAGTNLGNLAATQSGAEGASAQNLANVGQTGLNTGITAAAALQGVGQQQQQLGQANINTAMQNFQNQTMWPQEQTGFLSSIIRGLPAMGGSGTQASQTPTTNNMVGSVSPLSTLAGTIFGAGGVGGASGAASIGRKKGGLIREMATGGAVTPPPTPDEIDAEMAQQQQGPLSGMVSAPQMPTASPLQAATPQAYANQNLQGDESRQRSMQMLAMARGFLTPAHSGAEALGNAFGGLGGAIANQPHDQLAQEQVVGGDIANQMSRFGLSRAMAMNPMIMQKMQAMMQPGSEETPSADNAMFYALAGMPDASKVALSQYEHDPKLAGRTKAEQENNTNFITPEGTYVKGSQMGSAPAPQPAPLTSVAANALEPPPAPKAPRDAAFMPDAPKPANDDALFALDGKPFVPGVEQGMVQPDPSAIPRINATPSSNTKSGVEAVNVATKAQTEKIYKGDETLTSSLSSLNKEQFRIDELMKLYHATQAGTAMAHLPELTGQLVAAGIIQDPSTIHGLADLQTAAADHIMQIIQQIKDTNSNLGTQPTRTFSSEVSGMIDNGENAKLQPEALYKLLTQAKALTNYQADMVRGWTRIGGTGNRVGAQGYTLAPDTYAQKFMDTHEVGDYLKKIEGETKPFRGMQNAPQVTRWLVKNGKLVKDQPSLTGSQ